MEVVERQKEPLDVLVTETVAPNVPTLSNGGLWYGFVVGETKTELKITCNRKERSLLEIAEGVPTLNVRTEDSFMLGEQHSRGTSYQMYLQIFCIEVFRGKIVITAVLEVNDSGASVIRLKSSIPIESVHREVVFSYLFQSVIPNVLKYYDRFNNRSSKDEKETNEEVLLYAHTQYQLYLCMMALDIDWFSVDREDKRLIDKFGRPPKNVLIQSKAIISSVEIGSFFETFQIDNPNTTNVSKYWAYASIEIIPLLRERSLETERCEVYKKAIELSGERKRKLFERMIAYLFEQNKWSLWEPYVRMCNFLKRGTLEEFFEEVNSHPEKPPQKEEKTAVTKSNPPKPFSFKSQSTAAAATTSAAASAPSSSSAADSEKTPPKRKATILSVTPVRAETSTPVKPPSKVTNTKPSESTVTDKLKKLSKPSKSHSSDDKAKDKPKKKKSPQHIDVEAEVDNEENFVSRAIVHSDGDEEDENQQVVNSSDDDDDDDFKPDSESSESEQSGEESDEDDEEEEEEPPKSKKIKNKKVPTKKKAEEDDD